MTTHPGYVAADHSQDYPQWIAECPRCDWRTRPTVLRGLAAQWLRDHKDQQQQQQQQQEQEKEQG